MRTWTPKQLKNAASLSYDPYLMQADWKLTAGDVALMFGVNVQSVHEWLRTGKKRPWTALEKDMIFPPRRVPVPLPHLELPIQFKSLRAIRMTDVIRWAERLDIHDQMSDMLEWPDDLRAEYWRALGIIADGVIESPLPYKYN